MKEQDDSVGKATPVADSPAKQAKADHLTAWILESGFRNPREMAMRFALAIADGETSPTALARASGLSIATSKVWRDRIDQEYDARALVFKQGDTMSREEAAARATALARDDNTSDKDKIAAMERLSKWEGWDAPETKVNVELKLELGGQSTEDALQRSTAENLKALVHRGIIPQSTLDSLLPTQPSTKPPTSRPETPFRIANSGEIANSDECQTADLENGEKE